MCKNKIVLRSHLTGFKSGIFNFMITYSSILGNELLDNMLNIQFYDVYISE